MQINNIMKALNYHITKINVLPPGGISVWPLGGAGAIALHVIPEDWSNSQYEWTNTETIANHETNYRVLKHNNEGGDTAELSKDTMDQIVDLNQI